MLSPRTLTMRSGAEVTRANTPFTEWLAGVGEEPAPCVDLARTQPLVADDRAMQQCAEPAPGASGQHLRAATFLEAERRRLSGQREHLVVKLIAGDVVPRKVGAHRQQDEVVAGSRDIYVNQQPAVRRLPWRQGIGVGLESRLTGVGESEGLYLVGWKTERGEHTFNGLGLALQVQAV